MTIYGVSAIVAESLGRGKALEAIAAAGFRAVELSAREGAMDNWLADPAGMRRLLAAAGLSAWSVHAQGWDLASPDEAVRRSEIAVATGCLAPARDVGARVVVCHCNRNINQFPPEDYPVSLARTRQGLEALAEAAGAAGVRLAVETMMVRPGHRPGTTVEELLALIAGLGDHVGICLDTGHTHPTGKPLADQALLAGEKLFTLHIQDNHAQVDQDEHLLPGRGTIGWPAFLAALDRIPFTNPRIFEVAPLPGPDGPAATLAALAKIRQRWEGRSGAN